ncbi:clock controlled [Cordyceps militaris]|uniref:Clock controlled n=1 Tax=Cordyceps militaris TaxID=73501 RepID=A0A2H4SCM2_CORMI|nr:clock controlled [Cordyceps militaris]
MEHNHMLATASISIVGGNHTIAGSATASATAASANKLTSTAAVRSPSSTATTTTSAPAPAYTNTHPPYAHGLHHHNHHHTPAQRHPPPFRPPHPSTSLNLPPPDYTYLAAASASAPASTMDSQPLHRAPDYSAKLPPLANHDNSRTLPSLSSIAVPQHRRHDMSLDHSAMAPSNWTPQANTMTYRQPPPQPSRAESPVNGDFDGNNSVTSDASPDHQKEGTPTSVTLDDPDVRLAAEALGDLRADFVSSPPDASGTMSPPPQSMQLSTPSSSAASSSRPPRPEPLLQLLTTVHPFIASTVSNYHSTKNYSPRFKSGAEYVEGYLTPLAKTVNRTARRTGVEGGVRWFLGGRRHAAPTSEPESASNSKKRRKVGERGGQDAEDANGHDDTSPPTPKSARRSSVSTIDTLPAYDELRSPAYSETAGPPANAQNQAAWQTRLFMSTSGLSVAMSSESLKSLKYCLKWLRWTNGRMDNAIGSLKDALEEYESACNTQTRLAESNGQDKDQTMEGTEGGSGTKTPEEARTEIANRIQVIKTDILKTLQEVVVTVSKYAGGALPENARILVRRHLTSLPQRFRLATMNENPNANPDPAKDNSPALRDGAQKVLVLAKEGLDMVTQITGVLDGTIVSAEEWCERMGKKRESEEDGMLLDEKVALAVASESTSADVKMG